MNTEYYEIRDTNGNLICFCETIENLNKLAFALYDTGEENFTVGVKNDLSINITDYINDIKN